MPFRVGEQKSGEEEGVKLSVGNSASTLQDGGSTPRALCPFRTQKFRRGSEVGGREPGDDRARSRSVWRGSQERQAPRESGSCGGKNSMESTARPSDKSVEAQRLVKPSKSGCGDQETKRDAQQTLRVIPKNIPGIKVEMQRARELAKEKGWHCFVLMQDMEVAEQDESIPTVPRATPLRKLAGWSITCWFCGSVHEAGRRRSVSPWKCSARPFVDLSGNPEDALKWVTRVRLQGGTRGSFERWLHVLNASRQRAVNHWPIIKECCNVDTGDSVLALVCTRCGKEVPAARKVKFLSEQCEKVSEAQRVMSRSFRGGCKISSLNVGSLHQRVDQLAELGSQVVAVQEVCVSPTQRPSFHAAVKALGGSVQFGEVLPSDLRKGRSQSTRLGVGLAIVCWGGWKAVSTNHLYGPSPLRQSTRHSVMTSLVTDGHNSFLLHNAYIPQPGTPQIQHQVWTDIQSRIAERPQAHHVVAGDFQCNLVDSWLGSEMQNQGWHFQSTWYPHRATNHPPHGRSNRLDNIAISANLAQFVKGAEQEYRAGFSTHEVITLRLELSLPEQWAWKLVPPVSRDRLQDLVSRAKHDSDFWGRDAPDSSAADTYKLWVQGIADWLGQPANQYGSIRARETRIHREATAPTKSRFGVRQNVALRVNAWLCEIENVVVKRGVGTAVASWRIENLWRALARVRWETWPNAPQCPARGDLCEQSLNELLSWKNLAWTDVLSLAVMHAHLQSKSWKASMQDAIHGCDGKRVSRWLRASSVVTAIRTESDDVQVSPTEVARALMEAWRGFSCPGEFQEQMNDNDMHEMTRDLRSVQILLPEITGEALQTEACSRPESAADPGGVAWSHLKNLPPSAWQQLARFCQRVEAGDRWPEEVLCVYMIPVPKKGQNGPPLPLKTRLVALSSYAYRTWASLRARQLQERWLGRVLPCEVTGGRKYFAVEDVAGLESIHWDLAGARGTRWHTAYLDATKCFDAMRFGDVSRVLQHCGCPQKVALSLRRFQEDQMRHFQVSGWVVWGYRPKRGIPQGCPLSPMCAALWAATWVKTCHALVSSSHLTTVHLTAYMDDLTVASEDDHTMQMVLGHTVRFFGLWSIQLNVQKSALIHNPQAALTQNAREGILGELQSSANQVFLGCDTGWAPTGENMRNRIEQALDVAKRADMLPVGQQSKLALVRSWINPLLFGAEHGEMMEFDCRLSRVIRTMVWGTARASTCWPAALALAIPGHLISPRGAQFLRIWRQVHRLGRRPEARSALITLWNLGRVPRSFGFWFNFVTMVGILGGSLERNGVVTFDHPPMTMNLSQSLSSWLHDARSAWRAYLLRKAVCRQPGFFPTSEHHIDWSIVEKIVRPSFSLGTIVARAANTQDRSSQKESWE